MKEKRTLILLLLAVVVISACRGGNPTQTTGSAPEVTVAAASNLTDVFAELGPRFTKQTGIKVTFSFGATADLAKQIENGAPFDAYIAADSEHPQQLETKGLLTPGSRAIYARGVLVLWVPAGSTMKPTRIEDITAKTYERIAIAKPDVAPYGRATVESLRNLKIWDAVESRVIYGQNVSQTKQYASTGNAEVAFIPMALAKEGSYLEVPDNLHQPIDQALGIVKESQKQTKARKFVDFLLSPEIQDFLRQNGYRKPSAN